MGTLRDKGSFRDPSGFVFRREGEVYRQVNQRYRAEYDLLIGSGLYDELVQDGLLVPHEEASTNAAAAPDAYRVLKPEAVPFVSYPYEWCFSQLREAALTTLEVQLRALRRGLVLKDASAFNVQFIGTRPLLIDTLSFERYIEGTPWVAYRQFCQHFLAPLELVSRADARLGSLFVSFLDGIPLDLASRLLPWHTWCRFRTLLHLHLHARSIRRFSRTGGEPAGSFGSVSRTGLIALLESLRTAVGRVNWSPESTPWADYELEHGYRGQTLEVKKRVVGDLLARVRPVTVWDLGANTGAFSRIAAAEASYVMALDADHGAVEKHFRRLDQDGSDNVLPLCADLTNPTPAVGWGNEERRSILQRGPADAIMALALLHHLCISGNVPVGMVAEEFAKMGRTVLVEFVPKEDPQVQRLLRSRTDVFDEYDRAHFEHSFSRHFTIEAVQELPESQRVLYLMERRTEARGGLEPFPHGQNGGDA